MSTLAGGRSQGTRTIPAHMRPLGFMQLTALTLATKIPAATGGSAIPDGAELAVIRVEAQNLRWRDDGVAPTATVGMLILPADQPYVYTGDLANIQLIAATAGCIVNISFYG